MRVKYTVLTGTALLGVGLFYGYVLIPLGLRIPCVFYRFTGVRCPGCGITDLCLNLLHGRIVPEYNWGLMLMFPLILWLIYAQWKGAHQKAVNVVAWVVVAFLLLWTGFRNLYGF